MVFPSIAAQRSAVLAEPLERPGSRNKEFSACCSRSRLGTEAPGTSTEAIVLVSGNEMKPRTRIIYSRPVNVCECGITNLLR